MGLLRDIPVNEDCRLGLWHIVEDYDTLFRRVYMNDADIRRMEKFGSEARKVESLSVRALLQTMTTPDARIVYNESRKPFLVGGAYHISISHSNLYTAILLGRNRKVGIDLEYMSHRIDRVARKFIHPEEYVTSDAAWQPVHLYIHWCAKEAVYKICDKQDLNFQENIIISPFEVSADGNGWISGRVQHGEEVSEHFSLHYEVTDNYVIVYTTKKTEENL